MRINVWGIYRVKVKAQNCAFRWIGQNVKSCYNGYVTNQNNRIAHETS